MDRDEKGHWLPGHKPSNKGRGGRPKRSVEEKYLKVLRAEIKVADWKEIIQRAVARAKAGDNVARQWLSDWLLGKPRQTVDIEGLPELSIRLAWDDADRNDNPPEAA